MRIAAKATLAAIAAVLVLTPAVSARSWKKHTTKATIAAAAKANTPAPTVEASEGEVVEIAVPQSKQRPSSVSDVKADYVSREGSTSANGDKQGVVHVVVKTEKPAAKKTEDDSETKTEDSQQNPSQTGPTYPTRLTRPRTYRNGAMGQSLGFGLIVASIAALAL